MWLTDDAEDAFSAQVLSRSWIFILGPIHHLTVTSCLGSGQRNEASSGKGKVVSAQGDPSAPFPSTVGGGRSLGRPGRLGKVGHPVAFSYEGKTSPQKPLCLLIKTRSRAHH